MLRTGSFSILALALFVGTLAADDNWPQFRGPGGDGISQATDLPTVWSETQNIKWKTPTHGKGWSSPVIWGDQMIRKGFLRPLERLLLH